MKKKKKDLKGAEPKAEVATTTRREFLSVTGAVVAGAALTGCQTLGPLSRPSATLKLGAMPAKSYAKIIGANDRIRIGSIGTGGMGTGHIRDFMRRDEAFSNLTNATVVAVSDVYEPRLERARELSGGEAFHDYRDLLTSGNVDAVIIASPEHWHYQMAMDALQCGMDVYLQKPMTRTYEEAYSLSQAFSKSDRVFQLGSQYFQKPAWYRARELYKEGHLGKILMSQTGYHRNSKGGEWNYGIDKDARTGPGGNLDWERWLGPHPYMEYDPKYYFRWRKYREFSGGIITDLLPHRLHCLAFVLGADRLPEHVTCVGGIYVHNDRTVGDTVMVTVDYGDYVMTLSGSTCNARGPEDMIRGHEATLYVAGNTVRITPERPYAEEKDPIEERLESAPMGDHQTHIKEFLDSMRSRQQPTWDAVSAFNVMAVIAMAETAYHEKRTVHCHGAGAKLT